MCEPCKFQKCKININFSLSYPHIIMKTDLENNHTNKVEVVLLIHHQILAANSLGDV